MIFIKKLIESGIEENNIIEIALDEIDNVEYWNPFKLNEYVKSRIIDDENIIYSLIKFKLEKKMSVNIKQF